eukprot:gene4263-14375_t
MLDSSSHPQVIPDPSPTPPALPGPWGASPLSETLMRIRIHSIAPSFQLLELFNELISCNSCRPALEEGSLFGTARIEKAARVNRQPRVKLIANLEGDRMMVGKKMVKESMRKRAPAARKAKKYTSC